MSTASGLRRRRARLSRRVKWRSRYLAASFILHIAVIAAAALLFAKPPDEPIPIEITLILETGEDVAGQSDAPKSQEEATQQTAVAPRPNPKPAPPRKVEPRPSPPKAAPVARQVSPASTESLPVVEQAPTAAASPAASNTATDGQAASGIGAGTGATSTGTGQQAAATSGGGSGSAAGGGKTGRGANDYLERVRAALAKHKRYPDQARKLKQEGTVSISLHLARDGTVLGAQIAKASGFPSLDEAALQMARDASPVPRVPDDIDGDSVKIALPVTFSIGFFGRF